MRPKKKIIIERQIKIWEERVWYPDVKPEREEKDGELVLKKNENYDKIFSSSNFSVIHASETENIYRFLRYGIESGVLYNSNITFSNNGVFEAYIFSDGGLKDSYDYCNKLIKVLSDSSVEGKYIVCEDLNVDFNDQVACYFISELKKSKAIGLIFSSNKKIINSLYSCLKSSKIIDIKEV